MRIAGMTANRVDLTSPKHHDIKVWNFPNWSKSSPSERMAVLRRISTVSGRNPKMATLAVGILRQNNVKPRDYKKQAAVLLKFVQDEIYYINEPSERLQDPEYTLKVRYGDCDDMILLYHALLESINLKWKFVLVAKEGNKYSRWIEGTPPPLQKKKFAHIYGMVGNHPFSPTKWLYAEPTLKVPLGWDIVDNGHSMPELGKLDLNDGKIVVKVAPAKEKNIIEKISHRLKPSELLPTIIVSSITGILVSAFTARFLLPALANQKKRKK